MLEFDIETELMGREIFRIRQLLLTLAARNSYTPQGDRGSPLLLELEAALNAIANHAKRDPAELFSVLDDLLTPAKWEGSTLLQAALQQLRKAYDRLRASEQEFSVIEAAKLAREAAEVAKRANMTQVFISLYQADGFNMQKWAALLNAIAESSLSSRPVYRLEPDVCTTIRMKEQKQNEGYAAIYVSPNAILPVASGQAALDKQGHELVFIKEGALRPENMIYFCHISGRYVLKENILIRQGEGLSV
jgi:Dot/Icm secretion system protein IcmQ